MKILFLISCFILCSFSQFAQVSTNSNYKPEIHYEYKKFNSTLDANKFYNRLNANQKLILLNINRLKFNRLLRKSAYWIPDTFINDFLKYSPFPRAMKELDTLDKTMLISIRLQAFGLYEKGKLVYWGAVSTGKKSTPSPTGLHYMTFKKKVKVSTINSSWVMPWYFNIDVNRGIALHEYELPGYPASHGCIRMQERDAQHIYGWGEQWKYNGQNELIKKGTPVILFGKYDYENELGQIFNNYKLTVEELKELNLSFSLLTYN